MFLVKKNWRNTGGGGGRASRGGMYGGNNVAVLQLIGDIVTGETD